MTLRCVTGFGPSHGSFPFHVLTEWYLEPASKTWPHTVDPDESGGNQMMWSYH